MENDARYDPLKEIERPGEPASAEDDEKAILEAENKAKADAAQREAEVAHVSDSTVHARPDGVAAVSGFSPKADVQEGASDAEQAKRTPKMPETH